MVTPIATVNVTPNLPSEIQRLRDIAYNLRWAWDHDTIDLFRRIDFELWNETYHNPVRLLGRVSQNRLNELVEDESFMTHYNRVLTSLDQYVNGNNTWYSKNKPKTESDPIIAYFSMEFGIAECIQNYSGGLGVLSGDHLKSASDLGLPLIGVGLFYQEGYFQQYLNADGWQQESYPNNDPANLPIQLILDENGEPVKISAAMPNFTLYAQIWEVQVGRISLYLLDTNLPENPEEGRDLTDRLYGGDRRTRIRQEILMGIGGLRALEALGKRPDICHMNEPHSAFLALERIRQLMNEHDLTFDQAKQMAAPNLFFTTHTPVPAGLERFGFDLIDEHFTDTMKELGLSREEFINLGREDMGDYQLFSMALPALRMSFGVNGVAQLHGEVSRRMWNWVYPGVPENEVPIEAITNGIHVQTWISSEMGTLFDRYLKPAWRTQESRADIWKGVDDVPDSELWRTHSRRRERLIAFTRDRLKTQLQRVGASVSEVHVAEEVLNPDALTIGFARRFATYKRATLMFEDLDRLDRLVNNPDRPVQFIFAGKAHPHDREGKEFIRRIVKVSQMEQFRHSIVFIENYDMNVGRYLVQGVDVWLNNPRRPKEASGTSGMKVIYNGGLNLSVLDGWWAEAYSSDVGWAIGNGEEYSPEDWALQDRIEAESIYNILEKEVVPLFYDRGRDTIPRGWIRTVKQSMKALAPFFNTYRMVQEYAERFYLPNYERVVEMNANNMESAREFAAWRNHIETCWDQIKILNVNIEETHVAVGTEAKITAEVDLGELTPDDVSVQLYFGDLNPRLELEDGDVVNMDIPHANGGTYIFETLHTYETAGTLGFSVRVVPNHRYLHTIFQPNLITWA